MSVAQSAPSEQPSPEQPPTVSSTRPWGGFRQYCLNTPSTVKIIDVNAGGRLSLQKHSHRAELWVILDETLEVQVEGRTWRPDRHEEVWIPAGAAHRLSAPGDRGGRILEVGFGHFDEADIERLEDIYERV
ncbi:MAG: phosphomannose isomerase type II C-terminal cupin domain [Chloroflexota bacterium]